MKLWTIYCHIHNESGRRYIGLTSRTMERRWSQHIVQSRSSRGGRWHFPNAIRKYGSEAFSHEVLETCETLGLANAAEEKWIEHFDSRNLEKGFNIAKGGGSQPHPLRRNPWNDPEYRRKCSEHLISVTQTESARINNKASLNTPESKARRSLISKEIQSRPEVKEKNRISNTGISHSKEARKKISEAQRGRNLRESTKRKISESLKKTFSTPEMKIKLLNRIPRPMSYENRRKQSERYLKQREIRNCSPVVGMECKHHGSIYVKDCYVGQYPNGARRVECKICIRQRSRRNSTGSFT